MPRMREASEAGGPPPVWRIAMLGRQPGLTRAAHGDGPDDVWLRLGDRHDDLPEQANADRTALRSLLTAHLTRSGAVHIVTRCAPPALLLTGSDALLVPCEGRTRQTMTLAPGDLLVMCSAAALEVDPEGLVGVLADGALVARRTSPDRLLHRVMRGAMVGAAAVVQRHPAAVAATA
jgi:hypothetical protein